MLLLIAYVGYHFLRRQEYARAREAALAKASASSSSSSRSSSSGGPSSNSSKALSSKDIRATGLAATKDGMVGNPAPKKVSSGGKEVDPRKDPSASAYKKNYFLTMQGPGRPALVPFQDGLRPRKGEAEGTMWWDNVPDGESCA
jgi:hypothetical protein